MSTIHESQNSPAISLPPHPDDDDDDHDNDDLDHESFRQKIRTTTATTTIPTHFKISQFGLIFSVLKKSLTK